MLPVRCDFAKETGYAHAFSESVRISPFGGFLCGVRRTEGPRYFHSGPIAAHSSSAQLTLLLRIYQIIEGGDIDNRTAGIHIGDSDPVPFLRQRQFGADIRNRRKNLIGPLLQNQKIHRIAVPELGGYSVDRALQFLLITRADRGAPARIAQDRLIVGQGGLRSFLPYRRSCSPKPTQTRTV